MYQIGDLIEKKCRGCEFNGKNRTAQECVPCPTGKELKRLGNLLEPKKKVEEPKGEKEMTKITKEAYESMSKEGKTDSEIAKYFGVTQPSLSYQKKKWYGDKANGI